MAVIRTKITSLVGKTISKIEISDDCQCCEFYDQHGNIILITDREASYDGDGFHFDEWGIEDATSTPLPTTECLKAKPSPRRA